MERTKAFTLIELLIVVAIIAILAVIAVPNYLEAQTRAKVTRVQGDLHAMKIIFAQWKIGDPFAINIQYFYRYKDPFDGKFYHLYIDPPANVFVAYSRGPSGVGLGKNPKELTKPTASVLAYDPTNGTGSEGHIWDGIY